jgi:REP element-mobilizing transposase RayT
MIDDDAERVLRASLSSSARALNAVLHAVGVVRDHVHVVASIPPSVAIAEAVGRFKGASSHAVNHKLSLRVPFRWQGEYGVISLTQRTLPTVIDYAINQRERHAKDDLIVALEQSEPT